MYDYADIFNMSVKIRLTMPYSTFETKFETYASNKQNMLINYKITIY